MTAKCLGQSGRKSSERVTNGGQSRLINACDHRVRSHSKPLQDKVRGCDVMVDQCKLKADIVHHMLCQWFFSLFTSLLDFFVAKFDLLLSSHLTVYSDHLK